MSTDNKKISAYVPDVIYDRFIQFQEEHKLSMSKAAIEIFADYFGINLNPTISNESTGELLSRVDTLEKEVSDLKQSYVSLFKKVDLIQSTSEPLINKPLEVLVDKGIDGELDSSSEDKPLKEDIIEQPIDANIIDESKSSSDSELPIIEIADKSESSLDSEPPKQLQLIDSTDLLSELKSNPLQAKILSLRLKITPSEISIKKSKLSLEEFFGWIQGRDIDGIRWVIVGEGRLTRYIPADDTPIEKLQKVEQWLQANKN